MRRGLRLAALVLLALPAPLRAQTPIPIPGARPEVDGTNFGLAVAASGDRLAVSDGANSRVFIHTYEGGAWRVTASLALDPGVLLWTHIGEMVLDGTRLVVGTPGADGGRGAALVFDFDGTTWRQTARLTPSERVAGSQFGISVALAAGRIVVGQTPLLIKRGEDDAVFVFERDITSGRWTQTARLVSGIPLDSSDQQIDSAFFGWSVASQGGEIAVGTPWTSEALNPRGRVYRFLRGPSGWAPGASIETPLGGAVLGGVAFAGDDLIVGSSAGWRVYRTDGAGRSLAAVLADTLESYEIRYARALIGADSVFVGVGLGQEFGVPKNLAVRFVRRGETWETVTSGTLRASFPRTGSRQVAATPRHTIVSDFTQTLVFTRDARSGALDTLRPPDGARKFLVGTRAGTALDAHRGRTLVGMPGSDPTSPVLYDDRRGGAVVLSPTLAATALHGSERQNNTGRFVGLGDEIAVVGGSRYYTVHHLDGAAPVTRELFARRQLLSLGVRGATVAVGSSVTGSTKGQVEIVRCVAEGPCATEAVLARTPQTGLEAEIFGASVGLDPTGTHLAVGAPVTTGRVSPLQGPQVALYARSASGEWRQEGTLYYQQAPFENDPDPPESFGNTVVRTRDLVAVTTEGVLRVFERRPDRDDFRETGYVVLPYRSLRLSPSVAIGEGVIAVGEPSARPDAPGAVGLFGRSGAYWVRIRTLDGGTRGGISFGSTVAIDGSRLVVGAPLAGDGAGEVYEYDLSTLVAAERDPAAEALSLRVPNPVRSGATMRYVLDRPARVRLTVYDVLGRLVATLVDGDRANGAHEIAFASGLAPGAYIVRLDAGASTRTRTVVVLR